MGFVGNYAPYGLSPQTDGMPVIPEKAGACCCRHRLISMDSAFLSGNFSAAKKNLRRKSPGSSNKNKNFYFRKESAASCHCTSLSVLSYPYHILWKPFCQQKILAI